MGNISTLYRRIQFCKGFGATWKDSLLLIKLTLDYNVAVRSKEMKYRMQFDQEVHKIDVKFNGKSFPLHFRRQDLSMLYEVWMDESYLLDDTQLEMGDIVDMGAHVGFTTLYYWTLLGDGRKYICIEGSKKNAEVLQYNLSLISNVSLYNEVITSDGRMVRFYDEVSGHLHQVHNTLGVERQSTAVNDVLRNQTISICKMDIEGMEHEILTENNEWLQHVNQLHLELHDSTQLESIKNSMQNKGLEYQEGQEIVTFIRS